MGVRGMGTHNAMVPFSSFSGAKVYWALAGPSVSVTTPGKPQSLLSVPGLHCIAYVVAVASCLDINVVISRCLQTCTYRGNNRGD